MSLGCLVWNLWIFGFHQTKPTQPKPNQMDNDSLPQLVFFGFFGFHTVFFGFWLSSLESLDFWFQGQEEEFTLGVGWETTLRRVRNQSENCRVTFTPGVSLFARPQATCSVCATCFATEAHAEPLQHARRHQGRQTPRPTPIHALLTVLLLHYRKS